MNPPACTAGGGFLFLTGRILMTSTIEVGILGATGMVGQQFLRLLEHHPYFRPVWLAASERSEGRRYEDAAVWRLGGSPPASATGARVEACVPGQGPRLMFSALDASAATDLEPAFAAAGHVVVSNARSFRMEPDVPLLIPEINPDHLELIPGQRKARGWTGSIVTNPNCSTVVLAMALAPLRRFGIRRVLVTTLQAVSGAGYPGVPSFDIVGNVIPEIAGEESKIESEANKILGELVGGRVQPHPAVMSAHTTRVQVVDGHTMTVSIDFEQPIDATALAEALRAWRGRPQELALPSAPDVPIEVVAGQFRPQPRLDVDRGRGMTVTVGRIRECPVLGMKFVALGHNTVRGAAGAAILNAELMQADGWLEVR